MIFMPQPVKRLFAIRFATCLIWLNTKNRNVSSVTHSCNILLHIHLRYNCKCYTCSIIEKKPDAKFRLTPSSLTKGE